MINMKAKPLIVTLILLMVESVRGGGKLCCSNHVKECILKEDNCGQDRNSCKNLSNGKQLAKKQSHEKNLKDKPNIVKRALVKKKSVKRQSLQRMSLAERMKANLPKEINHIILTYIFDNQMLNLLPYRLTINSHSHRLVSQFNSCIHPIFQNCLWAQLPYDFFPVLITLPSNRYRFDSHAAVEIEEIQSIKRDDVRMLKLTYETPKEKVRTNLESEYFITYIRLNCGAHPEDGVCLKPKPLDFVDCWKSTDITDEGGSWGYGGPLSVDQKMLDNAVWGRVKEI